MRLSRARDYLKSLPESEFKYEGVSAEAILQALIEKTKPPSLMKLQPSQNSAV